MFNKTGAHISISSAYFSSRDPSMSNTQINAPFFAVFSLRLSTSVSRDFYFCFKTAKSVYTVSRSLLFCCSFRNLGVEISLNSEPPSYEKVSEHDDISDSWPYLSLCSLWRFRISNLRQAEVENVECNSFYTDDWIDYVNIHFIIESNQQPTYQ